MRDIKIKKVLNGFRVKVGCQWVVMENKNKLLKELSRYLDDPGAIEKEYLEKYSPKKQSDTVVVMENYDQTQFIYGDIDDAYPFNKSHKDPFLNKGTGVPIHCRFDADGFTLEDKTNAEENHE